MIDRRIALSPPLPVVFKGREHEGIKLTFWKRQRFVYLPRSAGCSFS
jgi:hypothetical protein